MSERLPKSACARVAAALALAAGGAALSARAAACQTVAASHDSSGFIVVSADSAKGGSAAGNQQIIFGDPSKPGLYVIRIRFAPGQTSRPHYHDQDRYVTVIKGTWWIALGPTAAVYDTSKMVPMKAGSFVKHPAGGIHYDGAKEEEAIVQIIGMGPVRTIDAQRLPSAPPPER
jgi:quercetin dioxygenase-like cupin family protein